MPEYPSSSVSSAATTSASSPRPAPEITAVSDFLNNTIPFDLLSSAEIETLARRLHIFYCARGHSPVSHQYEIEKSLPGESPELTDGAGQGLLLVRSGALDVYTAEGQLLDRLAEGESICSCPVPTQQISRQARISALEDTLVYYLTAADFLACCQQHPVIQRFFRQQQRHRLHAAEHQQEAPAETLRPLGAIMSRQLVTVTPASSIREAAQLMTEHRISSLPVLEKGRLCGILTDRDIRSRAVAPGLDTGLRVTEIMTPSPLTLTPDASLFDAVLLMTREGIHHLPITEQRPGSARLKLDANTPNVHDSIQATAPDLSAAPVLVGMLTASDLMLARQDDPVFLVQHIRRQSEIAGIKQLVSTLPQLVVQWQQAAMRAYQISHILTAISDSVTIRLIELALDKLGPAPVPFCWLGFGSQGRGEQLLGADQDNGLVLSNEALPGHQAWFSELARFVCDGLAECGYKYCPGDIMATSDSWRQPLTGWQAQVSGWVHTPTPDAVMRISIFFDIRPVYGDKTLGQALHRHMLDMVAGNQRFLAAMAENVLANSPPLGLFRQFVVEYDGEQGYHLDLKKRGVMPLVEIARIHSLAGGVSAVNTEQRFQDLVHAGTLTTVAAQNLGDALRVVTQVRIQNQSRQVQAGETPSNMLNPDQLSQLQRRQLKDAFTVVSEGLRTVKNRYQPSM